MYVGVGEWPLIGTPFQVTYGTYSVFLDAAGHVAGR